MEDLDALYILALAALSCLSLYFSYLTKSNKVVNTSSLNSTSFAPFRIFRLNFLFIFYFACAADWLQGPYIYKLYSSYGFEREEIGRLFATGYASSLFFGTLIGSSADKYGRKFCCVLYAIFYGIACTSKHFPNFYILFLGRVCSGIATSLLHSSFESWMIHEHKKLGYAEDLLDQTFQQMAFGKSFVAIICGFLGTYIVKYFGIVAVFDTAIVCLIVCLYGVLSFMTENYGENVINTKTPNLKHALVTIFTDYRISLLCLIQSCFESSMYIFVFQWTPWMEKSLNNFQIKSSLPHGLVFACFMVCLMIGSQLFLYLKSQYALELFLQGVLFSSAISLFLSTIFKNSLSMISLSFFIFELCCGIYFPSISVLRGKVIPGELRATIMSCFRVGVNLIVIAVLETTTSSVAALHVSSFLLMLSLLAMYIMYKYFPISNVYFENLKNDDVIDEIENLNNLIKSKEENNDEINVSSPKQTPTTTTLRVRKSSSF